MRQVWRVTSNLTCYNLYIIKERKIMDNPEYFVNINMTVKVSDLSLIRAIREAIEDSVEFKGTNGIVYFESEVEDGDTPNLNDLHASRDDGWYEYED